MKICYKILRGIRYLICSILLLPLMLIAAPFTMLFNWNGVWLLCIANEENCSLEEAKQLEKTISKYKFNRWNLNFPNIPRTKQQNFEFSESSEIFENPNVNDPSYSYLPENIFYNRNNH